MGLTVWTTPDSYKGKEHAKDLWELVYEREHGPSHRDYQQLEFMKPVRLSASDGCGVYVHSQLPGDSAIVYDNQRSPLTYEDEVFQVFPGLAHLSNRPFGRRGMWGFPWRDNREFVGRILYGVGYTLWNPEVHYQFPIDFRNAVKACLLCARRPESPMSRLQDDVVFFILNMCKYDWFTCGPRKRSSSTREGYHSSCSTRAFNTVPTRLGHLLGQPGRFPGMVPAHMLHFRPAQGLDLPDGSSDSNSDTERLDHQGAASLHCVRSRRSASGSASGSGSSGANKSAAEAVEE